jgi:hypothetical protein
VTLLALLEAPTLVVLTTLRRRVAVRSSQPFKKRRPSLTAAATFFAARCCRRPSGCSSLPVPAMVEHVSVVLACIDLAIRSGNAAARGVLTMRSNKSMLAELWRHFGDLRGALYSMREDPKLNTRV